MVTTSVLGVFLYLVLAWLALIGLYLAYRSYSSKRIICYFFNRQRRLYQKKVKPGDDDLLHVGGKTYHYNEKNIFYTNGFLLKEPAPALLFEESKPDSLSLFTKVPDSVFSSTELSEVLNDKTVTEFVRAQAGISPKQIITAVITMGIISSGISVTGMWLIMEGPNIAKTAGG